MQEIQEFEAISRRKDCFAFLIKSICPSIYGNELIKAGLILSLFGGTDYRMQDKQGLGIDVIKPDDGG